MNQQNTVKLSNQTTPSRVINTNGMGGGISRLIRQRIGNYRNKTSLWLKSSFICPCQGAADKNLAKFSSVGLKACATILGIVTLLLLLTTPTSATSITLSKPSNVELHIPDNGGIVTGSHTIGISGEFSNGYTITLSTLDSTNLVNKDKGNGNHTIPSITTAGSNTNNTWWYGLSNTDKQPLQQSSNSSAIVDTDSSSSTSMSRTVYYGARVDNPKDLASGNYTATVQYTATAKLPADPIVTKVDPNTYELCDNCSNKITITGTNLGTITNIYIDTNNNNKMDKTDTASEQCKDLTIESSTKLTCLVPTLKDNPNIPKREGTYNIIIEAESKSGVITLTGDQGFTYTYNPVPETNTIKDTANNLIVDYDTSMIPVIYTGDTTTPKWTSLTWDEAANLSSQTPWFNYPNKQWANAVTVDCNTLTKYRNRHVDIDNNDIKGFWVYIPRYNYQIQTITTSSSAKAKDFEIKFQTSADTPIIPMSNPAVNDWVTHPAFTAWDTNNRKVNGIWVGKFETTGSKTAPTVLPNQYHKANEYIGVFYDIAKSVGVNDPSNTYGNGTATTQNTHSLQSATTHMLKNSEWGAVAYLSSSKYGAGVNNVQLNASQDNSTGSNDGDGKDSASITGCGPSADGSTSTYNCSSDTTHQYQSVLGQLASTTNNVYGIYDMAGGAWEYVMGNWTDTEGKGSMGSASSSYFTNLPTPPYVDLYLNITSNSQCTWLTCGGDALYETANWGGDDSYFVHSGSPWFDRGGYWGVGSGAGLFSSYNDKGYDYYDRGFRVSLLAPSQG